MQVHEFKFHALQRMAQRGISEADVMNALSHHTDEEVTPKNSIRYIGPGLDGRDLKVWLLPPGLTVPGAKIVVKSTAWKD